MKQYANDMWAIVIDPQTMTMSKAYLPTGMVSFNLARGLIGCDYIELSVLTHDGSGLTMLLDEEGFINGSADRVGTFTLTDADGERLGQFKYAGRAILADYNPEVDEFEGWTAERADQIIESLTASSQQGCSLFNY